MNQCLINLSTSFVFIFCLSACGPKDNVSDATEQQTVKNFSCIEEQSPCFVNVDNGRIDVLFDVEKITAEQSFTMKVTYQGTQAVTQVTGYLEGIDMFMGKIPLFFEEHVGSNNQISSVNTLITSDTGKNTTVNSTLSHQYFTGEVLVGSCSEQMMKWRMWLVIKTNDEKEQKRMFTIVSHRS